VPYLAAVILAGSFLTAQDHFGTIRGTVVTIESDGSTSMIPGAAVVIDGREFFRQTTADDIKGHIGLLNCPPADIRFELTLLA
jgi:hypothetical protein